MTAGLVGASGGKPRKGPPTAYWYISDRDTVVRMDNKNERGQIRVPPRPNKKRRLGAIQIKPGSHPGRRGLYGQRSSSIGYNDMKKLPER